MPRHARIAPGGVVYHALNRGNGRAPLFEKPADFDAFERLMLEAIRKFPTRLLGYCLMGNHWHFVLWPRADGEMTELLRWLTMTHSQRLHAHRGTAGSGHVYQGRFKSFPVERDEHLLALLRYVERNPLRAGLVERVQDWRWCSQWRRSMARDDSSTAAMLSEWPIDEPDDWLRRVNRAQSAAEEEALRRCMRRGTPFGSSAWTERIVRRLGLQYTIRPRGRPRKRK